MVSIAIISLLLAIMFPAMSMVIESTRRVVCASNLRQVGIGMSIYADDNGGRIPFSYFADGPPDVRSPLDTVVVRSGQIASVTGPGRSGDDFGPGFDPDPGLIPTAPTGQSRSAVHGSDARSAAFDDPDGADGGNGDEPDRYVWDGIGLLVTAGYLSSGEVLYCPSHHGVHKFDRYAQRFADAPGEIVANFQYRGWDNRPRLDRMAPDSSLATDGFRDIDEINHLNGFNILRAGLSVDWLSRSAEDVIRDIASGELPISSDGRSDPDGTDGASPFDSWNLFDQAEPGDSSGGPAAAIGAFFLGS